MLGLIVLLTLFPIESSLDQIEQFRSQGQYHQALGTLQRIEREAPEQFRLNNLLYLQGVLEKEAGLTDQAREHFEQVLTGAFPLPDAVLLHLISLTEESPLAARRTYFQTFLTRFPSHPRWAATAIQFAGTLQENGQTHEALSWYGKVASAGRGMVRPARLNQAILQLGTAGTDSQRRTEPLAALRSLAAENETDQTALQAAEELHRQGPVGSWSEQDLLHQARIFLNHRKAATARLYLDRLLSSFPRSRSRAEYEYLNARAAAVDGDRRAALKLYQRTWARFPTTEWGITSRYLAGNLLLGLGDYQAAAESFLTILQNHPDSPYLERAATGLVDAHLWLAQRPRAEATLSGLIAQETGQRLTLNYYLARILFEDRRYREAAEALAHIAHLTSEQLPPGVTREEVLFLRGLSLEQAGSRESAEPVYQQAMLGSPNHFAHLSRGRLSEAAVSKALASAPIRPNPPFGSGRLLSARSFRRTDGTRAEEANPELVRVRELIFLRLFDELYFELKRRESESFFDNRATYLFQLAHFASRGGLYRESIDEAERLRDLLYGRTAPDLYPQELRELLYPVRYRELIEEHAKQQDLDPLLLLALIRQESSFRADAVSTASARGLMQLMPATARELATRLKIPLPNAAALNRPDVSIQLGSFYLRRLLNDFGDTEKALAAYNAGPGNVRRWEKKLASDDPLVFVSNIGFRETKLYVLRVLGHHRTYQTLYGEGQ